MFAGHPNPSDRFDLKHDSGGMVDVEFAVQYLVLCHSHAFPQLTRNAGNIAICTTAGELGLVPTEAATSAASAYREYRRLQHQIRLQGAFAARVDPVPQTAHRAAVDRLWREVFGETWQPLRRNE
jgi:glutamate-ammonia-ligase adenylyltransferase